MTRKRKKANKPLTERDILKMEIAKEIGIWEKVEKEGWQSLTNAECGRVGGIMKRKLQAQKQTTQPAQVEMIKPDDITNPV